jgi:hypothetical protein
MFQSKYKLIIFFQGLILGFISALIGTFIIESNKIYFNTFLLQSSQWLDVNLGYSFVFFLLIILLYIYIWLGIKQQLNEPKHENWNQIVHKEQLLEMLTSLAFGVGVIWTAIGMREALMVVFSTDSINNFDSDGAFGMLERLINGGIITALTSTVVGGAIGYFLRIFKMITLEKRLIEYQDQISRDEKNMLLGN